MPEYRLTVLAESGGEGIQFFRISSDEPLDKRLLQLAGLAIHNGVTPETIRREVPTAQMYVEVSGDDTEPAKWVDDSLRGVIG